MTPRAEGPALPPDVERELESAPPCEIAIGVLTYNNAETVPAVTEVVRAGLERHFPGVPAVLINADAGSEDGTPNRLTAAGLPLVRVRHATPLDERLAMPFHGVPGRGAALRLTFAVARRLGARGLVLLEADVTSAADEWLERLLRPVLEQKADLVVPVYARHRYDGTLTNLVLAPLVRALFGRRLHQPLAGAGALSARLLDRLLADPRWPASGTNQTDLWVEGTAIADGFAVWEAWLGPRHAASRARTADLPTLVAQAVGGLFALMGGYDDLWLDIRTSEPVPAAGAPVPSSAEPVALDVDRMVGAFRRGLRDLSTIWEHVLAPETLGDVLSLDASSATRLRFPDEVWARVVYDFALGHHYAVVYREHLLRSFVPLYLGRTAAFVVATRDGLVGAAEAHLDHVGETFELSKPYLVERWQ